MVAVAVAVLMSTFHFIVIIMIEAKSDARFWLVIPYYLPQAGWQEGVS